MPENAALMAAPRARTRMRLGLRLLMLAGLIPAMLVGASAFDRAAGIERGVSVSVVGDAAAYLSVQANSASPHDCFVSESGSTGKITISFSATSASCGSNGGGTGVNAAWGTGAGNFTRYGFHDLLLVTNKGTRTVSLWANATSSAGTVDVAKKATSGQMTPSDYAETSATPLSLAVGGTAYLGVRVNTTTLQSGSVTGTLEVVARGTG